MSWFVGGLFERRKDELDEEIRAHIAMDVQARMERGQSRREAEAAAQREFGNIALVRDVTHGFWRWNRLEDLTRDLAYTVRVLRRASGFSIAVILTLAVGIGSACAMFTVVDRVLLRALPYQNADRLVEIRVSGKRGALQHSSPYLDIEQWQKRGHAVSQIAFYSYNRVRVSFLDGGNGATHVNAPTISANVFETLGVHPALGRGFQQEQSSGAVDPQDAHSLILSDAVWRMNYGGEDSIVGKTVKLNGDSFVVIGVMPRAFTFPFSADLPVVWTPLVLGTADATRVHNVTPDYQTIARLQPGVNLSQAEAELKVIQSDVAKAYTDLYYRDELTSISLQPYDASLIDGEIRKALLALFGASALLWLIACVNVTSLMLARATARQREMAVRGAMGASRWQIVQQLLVEGLLLSGCGSMLGLGMAVVMLKFFEHGLVSQFSIHEPLTPNLAVLAGLFGLTILSALLISVWPAIGAARAQIEPALRQGAPQQGSGRAQHRTRALLVITEIALSLTLLVGCGLLLRTIYALKHVPLGFRTEHVMVAKMIIPSYKFAGRNMTTELYQPLVDRANHLPGIESASLMSQAPMDHTARMEFSLGRASNSVDDVRRSMIRAEFRAVGPEMQRVFGFPMVRGRFFNEQDTATSQAVVVVNRAFVKAYYGDERDPGKILGEHLLSLESTRQAVVVGVFEDEHQVSAAAPPRPEVEVCIPQITPNTGFYTGAEGVAMDLAVRTGQSPSAILPELREAMRKASPDLADSKFTTMDQIVEDSFGSQRLAAELLEIFGGSALFLCVAGIYGLLAYLVAQRTREMGLRIALGAQRSNVMRLVLKQAAWMLLAGLGTGLVLAYFGSLGLRTFLYGVKPEDPWTLVVVTLLLLVSGLAAAYWPARRAAMVDPMEALRAE
jgi:predicted permease